LDKLGEIGNKVLLSAEIAGAKPPKIHVIKRKKFHPWPPRKPISVPYFTTSPIGFYVEAFLGDIEAARKFAGT
jgi:hypothetical protein